MVAKESAQELEPGDTAPDFSLIGTDGATYTPASFASRDLLLVVFTCNHCPYAEAKVPAMNRLAAEFEEVAVVGINPNDATQYPDDSYERMCELVDDDAIRWDAYLRDDSQEVARAYGATCTPDPFLFEREDDEWRLVYHGRLDDAMNPEEEPSGAPGFEMEQIIDRVLAGGGVEETFRPSRGCSIKWSE